VWSVSSHLGLQRQGLDKEGVSGTAIYGQKGGKCCSGVYCANVM